MKTHTNKTRLVSSGNTKRRSTWRRTAALFGIFAMLLSSSGQAAPHHDIAAANVDVVQINNGNTTASVSVTAPLSINDFQVRDGSIRGIKNVQIGADPSDDAANGIMISSIRQNGRDNGETGVNRVGTNFCYPTIGITNVTIPTDPYVLVSFANATVTTNVPTRYNINVAGAWFPFSTWIGGHVHIASGANGSFGNGVVNDTIRGSAGLSYANNIVSTAAGKYNLNLTGLGIDSRTDGILLVVGGKNEDNWSQSSVNEEDGTWDVQVKNSDHNGNSTEEDPFAFVFIPRTNTSVVSGRFLGDGSIAVFSGDSPQFTVSSNSVGTYELKIPGYNPTNGVLIVSAEGGGTRNLDNMVTYEANAANNGWIIQTRDYPGIGSPLEALDPTEVVASFVFIPADNDLPNLVVSPATVKVVEGKTNTFTVTLKTQPVADVTVTVDSSNTAQGGTVSPTTLTFTSGNWNVPQPVSLVGVDDLNSDGNTQFRITNSVSSADPDYGTLLPTVISATTLDNEPAISLPSGGAFYSINSPGVGVDGTAAISDENTTNYNGTTLVVTITANGTADDRLQIRNTGTGPGQIGVSGNTISYEGVAIGTFSGGVGTTPLSVSFNAASNPTNAQALLQSVTFRNVSATPNTAVRSVSVVVTHPDTGFGSASTTVKLGVLSVMVFQQNVDSGYGIYTNAADCQIQKNTPFTAFPAGGNSISGLFVDFPQGTGNANQTLMRFDNLFGNGPGQIPTNAIIVSADLSLNLLDSGDGSPLYRMLISFDGESSTWDNFGGGVDQDNIESRSTFDSVFGLTFVATGSTNNSPNTGVGPITFSVLPDVKAWQNGDPNYGWVLPGSEYQYDGLGISPGESSNPTKRPKLRITWVPAGTASATFRQGVNGYASAQDTRIQASTPDAEASTVASVFVDWAVTGPTQNDSQVLIKFDDIIGTGSGQILPNSIVHAAVLDINSSDFSNAMGDGGTFHSMLAPWSHTDTWNTLVNGITADDVEAIAAPTTVAGNPALNPNVQAAFHTFDLTADVNAWALGARPNYGWVILPWPNGGDGWGLNTSDALNEIQRPQLRVYYTPGAPQIAIRSISRTASTVAITFSGEVGTTYSVRRAAAVDGSYGVIGSAEVQPNGTATFVDNAPLATSAFYQVSNP